MAELVQRFEAHPSGNLPVNEMTAETQRALSAWTRAIIVKGQQDPGYVSEAGVDVDGVIERQFDAVAPRCNEANCCRSIMLESDGPSSVLRVMCPSISEEDEQEAIRRQGRCERTIKRVKRDFPKFIAERAEEVERSQSRIGVLETELRGENQHLDSLLT